MTLGGTMVRVLDLRTSKWVGEYSCSPRAAVIAAYAQDLGDWNTWDYEAKYGRCVIEGRWTVFCGDFSALKEVEHDCDGDHEGRRAAAV